MSELSKKAPNYKVCKPHKDHVILRPCSLALALNLQGYRKNHRKWQENFAKESGIPQSQVAYLETGWANPKLSTLIKLSRYTGLSIDELIRYPMVARFKI